MTPSSQTHTAEHRVVARTFQVADQAKARRILLVSAHHGDGKSHLARCIARHASAVTEEPVEFRALQNRDPLPACERGYTWLDGLALLEGEGACVLTPSFRASIDGAVFVARGMATTRAEVAECAERLKVLGVPLLGGVWNERDHPPAAEALSSVKSEISKRAPRFLPAFLTRQIRRLP